MSQVLKYRLVDSNGETVLEDVSAKQIRTYLGRKINVSKKCRYHYKAYDNDNKVFYVESMDPNFQVENRCSDRDYHCAIKGLLRSEWDKVCKPFRNVEWVRPEDKDKYNAKVLEVVTHD